MSTKQIALTPTNDVTDATLKGGPPRLLAFLQGLADPAIRAKFASIGWSDERVHEAWELLLELKAANLTPVVAESNPTGDAIAACDAWARTGLVRARAMLQLRFPEQAAFMFADLHPGNGIAAVLNLATLLERRSALDHEAIGALEDGGLTTEVVEHLAALVATAQKLGPSHTGHVASADAARVVTLRKIHAWLSAWSEMARTIITRRDHLIRLGIAKRRPQSPVARA